MRVNVYSEELTPEVQVLEEERTGKSYVGIRFVLHSARELHHEAADDDRTAVTFWFKDLNAAKFQFQRVMMEIERRRV